MTHQEKHHLHHRKEREEHKAERRQHEQAEERSPLKIHPAWYLALGLVATLTATLIWTFCFAGSF